MLGPGTESAIYSFGSGSRTLEADAVQDWLTNLFEAAGMSRASADTVAACLMFAQRRGVLSHGVSLAPIYLRRLLDGGFIARPRYAEATSGAVFSLDAGGGCGAPAMSYACDKGAALASEHGLSLALVRNSGHAGALGFYADMLARRGLVTVTFCNADLTMVPPGGRRAALGSNPLSIGIPTPAAHPPLLDMATSAAAFGKIATHAARGEAIPGNWAVNADGKPTTDPVEALNGGLLPAAGPKGYGLAFMIDALAAGLSGGRTGSEITPLYRATDQVQGVSLLAVVIDPQHCSGNLTAAVKSVSDTVRNSGSSRDSEPMVPGEPESRLLATAGAHLSLPVTLITRLTSYAEELNAPTPASIRLSIDTEQTLPPTLVRDLGAAHNN